MAGYTALYDACVLYPAPLRDLLLQLAITDLFRAKWSAAIHDEWIRSLLKVRTDLKPEQLQRTRDLMDANVRDALIVDYAALIPAIQLPDPNDCHVVAAAIRGRCDVIVTYNLKHFPPQELKKYDLEVQHPDEFVGHLSNLRPEIVCGAVKNCRLRLKSPTQSVDDYLMTMAKQRLPDLVGFLNHHRELI
jgi:predicted nucleic acid-binding protein